MKLSQAARAIATNIVFKDDEYPGDRRRAQIAVAETLEETEVHPEIDAPGADPTPFTQLPRTVTDTD